MVKNDAPERKYFLKRENHPLTRKYSADIRDIKKVHLYNICLFVSSNDICIKIFSTFLTPCNFPF